MNNLCTAYDNANTASKLPFNASQIIDDLMGEPLGVDITNIAETPNTVIVRKNRDEYLAKRIAASIKGKYEVKCICKADMLIFS